MNANVTWAPLVPRPRWKVNSVGSVTGCGCGQAAFWPPARCRCPPDQRKVNERCSWCLSAAAPLSRAFNLLPPPCSIFAPPPFISLFGAAEAAPLYILRRASRLAWKLKRSKAPFTASSAPPRQARSPPRRRPPAQ